jgi:hypothetical protein
MQDAGPTPLSYTRAARLGTNWVDAIFSPAITRVLQLHSAVGVRGAGGVRSGPAKSARRRPWCESARFVSSLLIEAGGKRMQHARDMVSQAFGFKWSYQRPADNISAVWLRNRPQIVAHAVLIAGRCRTPERSKDPSAGLLLGQFMKSGASTRERRLIPALRPKPSLNRNICLRCRVLAVGDIAPS